MRDDSRQALDRFLASVERRALVMAELSTHNREEALDLVQDAMLAFVGRYANRGPDEWPPLFYRVLQNKMRDWGRRMQIRRRWRVWLHGGDDTADAPDPLQSMPDPSARSTEVEVDNQAASDVSGARDLAACLGECFARGAPGPERQEDADQHGMSIGFHHSVS